MQLRKDYLISNINVAKYNVILTSSKNITILNKNMAKLWRNRKYFTMPNKSKTQITLNVNPKWGYNMKSNYMVISIRNRNIPVWNVFPTLLRIHF